MASYSPSSLRNHRTNPLVYNDETVRQLADEKSAFSLDDSVFSLNSNTTQRNSCYNLLGCDDIMHQPQKYFEVPTAPAPPDWSSLVGAPPCPPPPPPPFSDSWSSRATLRASFPPFAPPAPPPFGTAPYAPPAPAPYGTKLAPPAPHPEWKPQEEEEEGSEMSFEMESVYTPACKPGPLTMEVVDATPPLTTTNVVVTVNAGVTIELKELLAKAKHAEWRPTKFPACVLRAKSPKSTALVFGSGKMVITGCKTVKKARKAARAHIKTLKKLGWDAKYREFKIVNLSAMMALDYRLDLNKLKAHLGDECKYNAERYPGLSWRLAAIDGVGKATLTVFATGKVVLVGCKSDADALAAAKRAFPVIKQFRA